VFEAPGKLVATHRKAVDGVCSCCRPAVDFDADGAPVVLTRFIYPGHIRDHALLKPGPNEAGRTPLRATSGEWRIEACPVHGPALSTDDAEHHRVGLSGAITVAPIDAWLSAVSP
jgi:hypothetical protein